MVGNVDRFIIHRLYLFAGFIVSGENYGFSAFFLRNVIEAPFLTMNNSGFGTAGESQVKLGMNE